MAYVRKTADYWAVMADYGYGWEEECVEFSHKDALRCLRDYRENGGGRYRLKKGRVRLVCKPFFFGFLLPRGLDSEFSWSGNACRGEGL